MNWGNFAIWELANGEPAECSHLGFNGLPGPNTMSLLWRLAVYYRQPFVASHMLSASNMVWQACNNEKWHQGLESPQRPLLGCQVPISAEGFLYHQKVLIIIFTKIYVINHVSET